MINAYNTLVRNPERKRPLERPSGRWEGETEMDLTEINT
jgi:hypothetical protein